MRCLCRQIAGKPVTMHGFRSSFRDWCAQNGVSRDLAETSLAHDIGSKVEKAYNRHGPYRATTRSNGTLGGLRLCHRQLLNLGSPVNIISPI